jgi:hypothetical protein
MFDPLYIVLQIVCLQCLFYLGMGTIWELVHTFTKVPVSLDHFFSTNYINFVSYSSNSCLMSKFASLSASKLFILLTLDAELLAASSLVAPFV